MHSSTLIANSQDDETIVELFQTQHPWGIATCIDLKNCNPTLITSKEKIQSFVDQLCKKIQMKKFGPCTIVHFGVDPKVAGFSMTQLIETSLISGHFANETNAAYIDIFSCASYPPHETAQFAQEFFEADERRVTVTFRY